MNERRELEARRRLALAALAFALLVLCASLVPLDPHPLEMQQAWQLLVASTPPTIESKTDFLANLLLQLPLGFLLTGALGYGRERWRGRAVALSTVTVAVLALMIEFAQGMFAARTPSTADVLAETIGALGGALLWIRIGTPFVSIARDRLEDLHSPSLSRLAAYATVWLLWCWMPFDFTIRLAELSQKYRSGLLVLWPGAPGAQGLAVMSGDMAGHWLIAVPIGAAAWLLTRHLRAERIDVAYLVASGLTFVGYAGSLIVMSRAVDLGAIAAAGLGALTGVWWADRPQRRRTALVTAMATVALIANQWTPFQFSTQSKPFTVSPFQSYAFTSPFEAAADDLLRLQLGFSVLFLGCRTPLAAAIQGVSLILMVEGGQLYLPARDPATSDILLLCLGAVAGAGTRRMFEREVS